MIVVNFSTKEYLRGQQRLSASLNGHKFLMFDDYAKIGSPTQKESPYEFKIHAIKAAMAFDTIVLWCDASLYRVGDLKIIEDLIKSDGYFMSEAGHYVGRWTNDFTKNYFRLTEEESKQDTGGMIMFSAGLLGLDTSTPIANEFLSRWEQAAKAGCFKGDYSNHRHDMSSASIIASRLGMKYQRGGQHMSYIGPGYSAPEPDSVFHLQGIQ
jgi:hypothetical protein